MDTFIVKHHGFKLYVNLQKISFCKHLNSDKVLMLVSKPQSGRPYLHTLSDWTKDQLI